MIHLVLPIIVGELNNFLKRSVVETEDKAILSNLVDQSGALAFTGENKVICLLTGIEQERTNLNSFPAAPTKKNPPIYLNLYLLFAAYFPSRYDESLKFMSLVISYFQGKQLFTPQNTPGLPPEVEKISIEIHNIDQHNQSQLWSAIGAKMMPSISMKLRMLAITKDQILAEIPEITGIDTTAEPSA